ncbi:hypothetical protein [Reyranella soli]|uniref:hypothetical protein n=1 Tax=Reyranella soli TaxID=1230389 RepID=UPI001478DE0B|nr:hypothetical protein [Reyranella soli]
MIEALIVAKVVLIVRWAGDALARAVEPVAHHRQPARHDAFLARPKAIAGMRIACRIVDPTERGAPLYRRTAQPIRHQWTHALRLARQWLAERVEDFPIPVEDVIWVERAGHSVATDDTLIRRLARPLGR